jgi:hypothetical protein
MHTGTCQVAFIYLDFLLHLRIYACTYTHNSAPLHLTVFFLQVVQAEGPDMELGTTEFPDCPPLVLTYHRHAYGLGAHYNSVQPSATAS